MASIMDYKKPLDFNDYKETLTSFSKPQFNSMLDWGGAATSPVAPAWDSKFTKQADFATAGNGPVASNWWDSITGSIDPATGLKKEGWGNLALGAANGLMNGYMGMKNYGLAKDTFDESKRQFALNYGAQKTTTNNEITAQNQRRQLERPDLQRDQKLVA